MTFPNVRPRRLRTSETLRAMVRETTLTPSDFVLPLFAMPGKDQRKEVSSMPGVFNLSVDQVVVEAKAAHALGVPGLPVDRHVLRVSNRIGIASGEDPVKVEAQLCAALPKEMWTLASDVQILHGRRVCKPKPLCPQCSVRKDCDWYFENVGAGLRTRAQRPATRAKEHDTPRVRKARR